MDPLSRKLTGCPACSRASGRRGSCHLKPDHQQRPPGAGCRGAGVPGCWMLAGPPGVGSPVGHAHDGMGRTGSPVVRASRRQRRARGIDVCSEVPALPGDGLTTVAVASRISSGIRASSSTNGGGLMSRISRRTFLYFSAVAAGTWSLTACTAGDDSGSTSDGDNGGGEQSGRSGSAAEPLPKPATFQQAPSLDGQGLPPVEERLPDNPYVIPHSWVQPGKYGGTINMNVFSSTGAATADSDREFFYGHSPLRFLNDGKDVVPWTRGVLGDQRRRVGVDVPVPQGLEVVRWRGVDHREHHLVVAGVRAGAEDGGDAAGRDPLGQGQPGRVRRGGRDHAEADLRHPGAAHRGPDGRLRQRCHRQERRRSG